MSELGDDFRAMRQARKRHRDKHAIDCPGCPINRNPTKLYPGIRCRVCGYTRPEEDRQRSARGKA